LRRRAPPKPSEQDMEHSTRYLALGVLKVERVMRGEVPVAVESITSSPADDNSTPWSPAGGCSGSPGRWVSVDIGGTMVITLAETDSEIRACFKAMRHLRTQLVEETFPAQVREMMTEGYRLAFIRDRGEVVCVAGFRVSTNFFVGRHLYVEDLATIERRQSTGYGSHMMAWLRELALREGCAAIDLDSGVQRHRAHRFYLNRDMQIACYHFLERLV
jgi:GNAT superfamily N-acetyltransferase